MEVVDLYVYICIYIKGIDIYMGLRTTITSQQHESVSSLEPYKSEIEIRCWIPRSGGGAML